MLSFNTSLVLALGAAVAAGVATWVTGRLERSIAVGVAVLLALSSLISVVRDAADNALLERSPHMRIEEDP